MRSVTCLSAFVALCAAGVIPREDGLERREAAADVAFGNATVTSVTTSGNGCPSGANVVFQSSGNSITVTFADFKLQAGPNASTSDRTKNCQLHVNLKYPAGSSVALAQITNKGTTKLGSSGVKATALVTTFFSQDATATGTTSTSVDSANGAYSSVSRVADSSRIWSECGSTSSILNINDRIALSVSGDAAGDTTVVNQSAQIDLVWKKC